VKSILPCLFSAAVAFAGFSPSVRIDHGTRGYNPSITLGPSLDRTQPVYVTWGDEGSGSSILFQRSTNSGVSWLPEDKVIRHSGSYVFCPDVAADPEGNVYIVYGEKDSMNTYAHMYCVRSTDSGGTWSAPSRIDDDSVPSPAALGHVAIDAAGNLFCAWEDMRNGSEQIWSSASTDRGTTWKPNVRVDDDTFGVDCFKPDVYVQPGTNHYLVATARPYQLSPGVFSQHAFFYRSTDTGRTFEPGVQLDSLEYISEPHVVADAEHVICDYSGDYGGDNIVTQARTLYTLPDTWGPCRSMSDTSCDSYYSASLAVSKDGRVHTALMLNSFLGWGYDASYSVSTDHGATWSVPERVNDDVTSDKYYPDIEVDSAGNAYVVWMDMRNGPYQIWFSTNHQAGIAEGREQRVLDANSQPTVCRRLPAGAVAFDAMGRRVLNPRPGIYFLRAATTAASRKVLLVE
jgi:hypothetical protein